MAQSIASLSVALEFPVSLNIKSVGLTNQQLHHLCSDNRELRFEITKEGELIFLPPRGAITGHRNSNLSARVGNWADADGTGLCFDSSTLFTLPNGAKRSPDLSWIRFERWNVLTEEEQEDFAPICPDFIIELRSKSDSVELLLEKVEEYIENGAQLGWLIDPQNRRVYLHRPNQEPEILDHPATVDGEAVLPGLVVNLSDVW